MPRSNREATRPNNPLTPRQTRRHLIFFIHKVITKRRLGRVVLNNLPLKVA
ncbi:hypothetical protein KIN20_028314 [Parelaphostrongylus tenuis]|uniref:Uncharacterized protein n=1 Tax=Parelaphostrongylus tenuis TaxID=148309 RepID=A0AAD5R1E7_PARTN|nr:hypothetical protein KIN20_028314 [Parelaphostrongylus tenuis]